MPTSRPFAVTQLTEPKDLRSQMVQDVREGLTRTPKKQLPYKYLYDARGSELFEEITRQPEYYPTRAETEILDRNADRIMEVAQPAELMEIGSGSSRKTRLLLEAMHRHGATRYVPLDVSRDALEKAAGELTQDYPWLDVDGYVADFESDLDAIPREGHRLAAFLGSTMGNLDRSEHAPFLRSIHRMLEAGDTLLLGVDLVKDPRVIEAAYNDAAGVTSRFTKNILEVVNRELDGDLPIESFEHVATWDGERELVDIRLRAGHEVDARLETARLDVHLDAGEEIEVEISCKFTRSVVRALMAEADFRLESWYTDSQERFALALATPAS